jgi:hypothetical protein
MFKKYTASQMILLKEMCAAPSNMMYIDMLYTCDSFGDTEIDVRSLNALGYLYKINLLVSEVF